MPPPVLWGLGVVGTTANQLLSVPGIAIWRSILPTSGRAVDWHGDAACPPGAASNREGGPSISRRTRSPGDRAEDLAADARSLLRGSSAFHGLVLGGCGASTSQSDHDRIERHSDLHDVHGGPRRFAQLH